MRAAAFLAVLLLTAAPARPAVTLLVGQPVLDIPVVKTANDLQNADALTMGGAEIHVGIQANACNTGDGLLVYVYQLNAGTLTVKESPNQGVRRARAGSVYVDMVHVDEKGRQIFTLDQQEDFPIVSIPGAEVNNAIETPGKALYTCPFHAAAAGRYEIRVYSLEDDLLARTTVTVDKNRAQPWFPVSLDGKLDEKEKFPLTASVQPIAAVPNWNAGTLRPLPGRELPRLVPAESADFHIEAAAGDLSVTLKRSVPSEAAHCLLARVWINGAPVLDPKFTEPRPEVTHDKIDQLNSPVKFSLRLVLSDLGVDKADKVEIQLAYCEDGFLSLYSETSNGRSADERKDPPVLVSNRITLREAAASK